MRNLTSHICKHHNEFGWFCYARELKTGLDTADVMMFVATVDEMKAKLDSEMELNKKPSAQSFSGVWLFSYVAEVFFWEAAMYICIYVVC